MTLFLNQLFVSVFVYFPFKRLQCLAIYLTAYCDVFEFCNDAIAEINPVNTEVTINSPQYPQNYSTSEICTLYLRIILDLPSTLYIEQRVESCSVSYMILTVSGDAPADQFIDCRQEGNELLYTISILFKDVTSQFLSLKLPAADGIAFTVTATG